MLETIANALAKAAGAAREPVENLNKQRLRDLGLLMISAGASLRDPAAQRMIVPMLQQRQQERQWWEQQRNLTDALQRLAQAQGVPVERKDIEALVGGLGPKAMDAILPQIITSPPLGVFRLSPPIQGPQKIEPVFTPPQQQGFNLGLPPGQLGAVAASIAMEQARSQGVPFAPEMAWLAIPEAMESLLNYEAAKRSAQGGGAQKFQRGTLEEPAVRLMDRRMVWVKPDGSAASPQEILYATAGELYQRGWRAMTAERYRHLDQTIRSLQMIAQVAYAVALAELSNRLLPMNASPATRAVEAVRLNVLARTRDPALRTLEASQSEMYGLARGVFNEIGMRAMAAFEGLVGQLRPGASDYATLYNQIKNLEQIVEHYLASWAPLAPRKALLVPLYELLPPPSLAQQNRQEFRRRLGIAIDQLHRMREQVGTEGAMPMSSGMPAPSGQSGQQQTKPEAAERVRRLLETYRPQQQQQQVPQ